MSQYGLAIHTTSQELGLAISNFADDRRVQVWNLGRETSNYLHQYLLEFIQPQTWKDLAFLVVAKGPGGFTGTRIGVVTARTLAQQLEIPLFAISTLAGVAWREAQAIAHGSSQANPSIPDLAVQMRAQRGEVFGAMYRAIQPDKPDFGLSEVIPDRVMSLEVWQHTLQSWHTPHQLIHAEQTIAPSVEQMLELAYCDWQAGSRPQWSEALPFYGQYPVEP